MLNTTRWLSVILLIGLVACTEGVDPLPVEVAPKADDALAPGFSKASECYTPKFKTVFALPQAGTFVGQVSGDLEGSVTLVFDPGQTTPFTGVTNTSGGTAHWTITGGIIPGLGAFETQIENRNFLIDRPGSPGTLVENQGRHRALQGVEKANLTYKGTADILTLTVDHDYNGVICL